MGNGDLEVNVIRTPTSRNVSVTSVRTAQAGRAQMADCSMRGKERVYVQLNWTKKAQRQQVRLSDVERRGEAEPLVAVVYAEHESRVFSGPHLPLGSGHGSTRTTFARVPGALGARELPLSGRGRV